MATVKMAAEKNGNGKLGKRKMRPQEMKGKKRQQKINVKNNVNGKGGYGKYGNGKLDQKLGQPETRQRKWTSRKKGNTKLMPRRNGNGTF